MARESVQDRRTPPELGRLAATHWKQLYDLRAPLHRDVRLDHVLVGPSGVYVIGYLPVAGRRGLGDAPRTTVVDWADTVAAVGALLPPRYRERVRPVLCSRSDDPLADQVQGVLVTSYLALGHILRSSRVQLSTSEIAEVSALLRARLKPWQEEHAPAPKRSVLRRWLVGAAAAAAAVAAGVTFGPDLAGAIRLW
jgi:hypothetical protein